MTDRENLIERLDVLAYQLRSTGRMAMSDAVYEAIAALSAPERPVPTLPEDLVKVLLFLNGEIEINGNWFSNPGAKDVVGPYWWRRYLKPFLPKAPAEPVQDDTEAQRQSWLKGEMAMGESVAAKPERESLEQAFKRKFGVSLSEWMAGGYTPAGAEVVGWIIRIMDQNKLDERGA